MMIPRIHLARILNLLKGYPAVALAGPRQAGKTTLAKSLGGRYFDLEDERERLRLDVRWDSVVDGTGLTVFDEAQAWPDLFPRLRGAIDSDRRRNGRFLILGSVSPALMRQISESLAGRLGLCELTPLLAPELARVPLDRLWRCGGFPDGGVLTGAGFPEWQGNYLQLLAGRDLPQWGLEASPQLTMRLFRMVAAHHSGVLNASELGRSLGITYHTVNSYLDRIEGAFLIRRLVPFYANIGKRLVKSPKVYWRDTGLLHALLGIATYDDLTGNPKAGASWEGFVIEQVIGVLSARGVPAVPSFFRTSDGHEIDLVLEMNGERWAVEVKLTSAPGPGDLDRLNGAADMIKADRRILVSRVKETVSSKTAASTNLHGFLKILAGASRTAPPTTSRRPRSST